MLIVSNFNEFYFLNYNKISNINMVLWKKSLKFVQEHSQVKIWYSDIFSFRMAFLVGRKKERASTSVGWPVWQIFLKDTSSSEVSALPKSEKWWFLSARRLTNRHRPTIETATTCDTHYHLFCSATSSFENSD